MKSKLFEVFVRGRSQSPMKLHNDKVAALTGAVKVILGADLGSRLRLETRLDSDGRESLVFLLEACDQFDIFRTNVANQAQEEQEVNEALEVVHRKAGVLRSLMDKVSMVPSEFWEILATHDIDADVLDVWRMSCNFPEEGFRLIDSRGRGQTLLFKDVPRILTRAKPLVVEFRVDSVASAFAEGKALRFGEAPEVPVSHKLTLVWGSGNQSEKTAHRLLAANVQRKPIVLIAHPAMSNRAQVVALELVRLCEEPTARRRRIGLQDWRAGDWPMPRRSPTEQSASALPLFSQLRP